ncbi:LOW QUALITY PROTEIN: hypothetical protein Smp_041750 [Schistosoma mansoni]|uniref:hypothetical protein n=1 Tax=Schistosoma mansoni TaxID=6183 RepID=UPI00022DC786|nr:LOW QUALITY PROTEIN: hypothetical protein Smp_041750 [Schistosoma mansoni]|eukprot:XP_018652253.1 LOW QUALITY PROTEIN: hypothetical protein Smp_041750 [Schistosoma mansoni]
MASSSAAEGMSITKGGSILVKVEDLTGELISVKLIDGDKIFRGILLQETIGKFNEYGTNLERITSAPFWPPLSATTSGINLKTIPCSTERYSYKLEGQPSNLNVFQPDPTKRSHRNQPAPQLSRILRPRRFVCRKCKKAFHLEEHGTELSSSFLTDLIDRRTCDSSALSSDNEVSHYLPKSNISDQITPAILNGNSQSIRHVTPPIIPKLNEEMKINVDDSSKSEIDSSSDIRSKSKKHFISEQSTKTPESLEPKLVMSKKRKVDVPDKQKLKRIKLSSQKLTEPNNVSNTVLVATPPVVNPDSSSDPALPSSFSEETKDFSTSPSLVGKTNSVDSLSSQEQTRKNRIKAQYVSVTSPFRYPFGEKNISSKQEIGNVSSISDSRIKVESNAIRKGSEKSEINSLTSSKTNLGVRKNSRYRTRTQLNPLSVTSDSLGPSCSVKDLEDRSEVDEILPSDSLDGDFPQKENIPNSISPRLSSPSKEKYSTSVQLTCKTSTYGHNSASNNFGVPMGETNFSPQSRRKAFDYEKPKNRWMREARARRCQDERNSIPSSTATSHISSSSNNTDTDNSTSCNPQSPSLNRLRIRSGDGSSVSPSESALKSNNNVSSKVKLPNGSLNNRNSESGDASQSEKYLDITDQKSASTSHVSPCLTPTSDSSGLALPVIKIKINRNRQPSGCSKTVPTHYEVVKLQTGSNQQLATSASKVVSEQNSLIANANPSALKLDIQCNGLRSPSPSPSAGSSKKGSTCESLIMSGPLVRRCKLHDGIVFRVGDLVWSKLSGWPYWPAQITSIQRVVANENDLPNSEQVRTVVDSQEKSSPLLTSEQVCYTACLHWFAWHQVSYMPCDKLFHFLEHCKRFDNKKKRGVFRQAVNEAKQAAEKRQETHSTDSESDWDHELSGGIVHQQSLSQSSEIPVLDGSKESEVSQTASSLSIPDINPDKEVNATTKQSKYPNNKVRKSKTKVCRKEQGASVLCPSVVDSSNTSLGQTNLNNMDGEVTASIESKLHVISKRRSKQQTKNKVYPNTSEDKKILVGEYDSLTNTKSNVRLKIILSKPKSKSKLKCAKVLSNNTQNSFENEVNISSLPNLDVPNTDNKIHQIVENSSKDTESPFTSEIIPESNISTTDSQDFDKTFSATHSELLTQFPHVFPDLKVSGILSDTVEIPTFSEDESEEEDAGRLIIDPDVMASVNVPLSTGNHHYITETLKQDPDVLREDLYSLSSDNMSYNHELSSQAFDSIHPYSRTSSTTLPQSSMSSFGNPVYSSDSFTHSFNSSTYSTECLISQPVSVYPTHNQSLIQTVLPSLTTPPLLASSTVSNLSVPSRSAYFQPSHVKVPSTTTHNVSYVTTEYSTL